MSGTSLIWRASCFTPHDPQEDTESFCTPAQYQACYKRFTPHDPQEDTESQLVVHWDLETDSVSPPTIRKRILKVSRYVSDCASSRRFTPHDPQEDTESVWRVFFHPQLP